MHNQENLGMIRNLTIKYIVSYWSFTGDTNLELIGAPQMYRGRTELEPFY
jgi:ribonucleotide reductase beta subunit family protein with ferritin-like domain